MRQFLALLRSFFHSSLLYTLSFHPFPTTSLLFSHTSSCHLILGQLLSLFYQLDAQILYFNTFITFLYMFRALLCSSSGGQIVLVQPLVLSLSLGDCSVHRLRKESSLNPCTEHSPKESDDTSCCTNII